MSARENILAKLRQANAYPMAEPQTHDYYQEMSPTWDNEVARLKHWAKTMRAVKTEICWVREHDWENTLVQVAQQKGLRNMLLSPQTAHGKRAETALAQAGFATRGFEQKIDDWKDDFFANVDAGFTTSLCGIAHTGTVMLVSSPELTGENLVDDMPTNIILISGPSKTADIQLTLAFGAHGPRDLVVLAVLPEHITVSDLAE